MSESYASRAVQQGAQSQQFYDSQRYQSDQNAVNTLGRVGSQFVDTQRDQAMLQMEEQKMQRELSMQEADANMRLAIQQQEQQQNALKLQMMTALDQAKMGRLQAKQMELQTDAMEFDLEQKRKAAQQDEDTRMRFQKMLDAGGGMDDFLRAGYVAEEGALKGLFRKDVAAANELLKAGRATTSENQRRLYLQGIIASIDKTPSWEQTEEQRSIRANAFNEMIRMDPELMKGVKQGSDKQQSGDTKPSAADTKKIEEIAMKLRGEPAEQSTNPMTAMGGTQDRMLGLQDQYSQQAKSQAASSIWASRAILREAQQRGYDKDPSRKGLVATDDSAIQAAIDILNDPRDPRRAALLKALGVSK